MNNYHSGLFNLLIILLSVVYQGCNQTSPEIKVITGTNLADTLKDNSSYTGIYKSYHLEGYLYSEVRYKNGKKDGISKRFYPDGKVHSIIEYANGKKEGTSKWLYTSGEDYRVTTYVDGKIHGIRRKFYRDGTIQAEIPYDNGNRKIGLKEYNREGTLLTSSPEIIIESTDRIQTHRIYSLKITLSNNSKEVKFYYGALKDSIFLPDGKNALYTQNGVGIMEFVKKSEGSYPRNLEIVAYYRTRMGNRKILSKQFRLPSDDLAY